MKRTIASISLLLVAVAAPASRLQAQWPATSPNGASNAGIAFRPGLKMVTVTWLKADTVAKYKLFRAADTASTGTDISGLLATTMFVDKTAVEGVTYFYHVQAARPGAAKPMTSSPQRFMLAKPVAVELPAKKKP